MIALEVTGACAPAKAEPGAELPEIVLDDGGVVEVIAPPGDTSS